MAGRPLSPSPVAYSVLHVNGIAVYVEEQDADGEGGAIMVGTLVSLHRQYCMLWSAS